MDDGNAPFLAVGPSLPQNALPSTGLKVPSHSPPLCSEDPPQNTRILIDVLLLYTLSVIQYLVFFDLVF